MSFVPYVVEQSAHGERSYDIFSRLLNDRIIVLSEDVNDTSACAGLLPPQSAEANLCRVRPLQHSEWRAAARNSGGTVERSWIFQRRFIP